MKFIAKKPERSPEEKAIIEKRKRNRYFRIVKVRNSVEQLALISPPKGICFTKLNPFQSKRGFEDGNIVVVYTTDVTPNDFEKRTPEDIDEFIATNLSVIEDNPKGVNWRPERKFETTRNTEYVRKHSFNERTIQILDEQLKQINKEKEKKNEILKSKPFNREDIEEKLDKPVLKIVEI